MFLSLLKGTDGHILDIGANVGIMTYHLAKAFPTATIHSFEPIPDNFSVLKRIVSNYGLENVKTYSLALGSTKETLRMVLPENGKTKMQGLSHVKHASIPDWNEGIEFDVECTTLDALFADEMIQGIKIDIENFEYFAFLGGKSLLTKNKPLIYAELWDNENRRNCFDLLTEMGYKIFVVCRNELVEFDEHKHQTQNFIFKSN